MVCIVRRLATAGAAALLGVTFVAFPLGISSSIAQQSAPPLPPAPYAAPAAPAAAPSPYDWNGFYVGLHGGWGSGNESGSSSPLVNKGDNHSGNGATGMDGIVGGGQIGFNWMAAPKLVLGAEADLSGAGIKGTSTGVSSGGTSYRVTTVNQLGTLRGRVGYPIDNWLIYGTGGLAWEDIAFTHIQGACLPSCGTVAFGATSYIKQNRTGWTFGGGVELGMTSNWTAKLEYLYMNFGSYFYSDPVFNRAQQAHNSTINVLQFGVNYKFD